jgi:peroxiredoxin
MLALGAPAPPFTLPEPATGATVSLDELTGPALVVTFICNHCPYVQHVAAGLAALGRDLTDKGVAMVGICSNDVVTYPQDGPDQMVAEVRRHGWTFPYLYDQAQDVAHAFLRGLHARHVRLRRRASTRLPRPARRLPPPKRPTGDGR